MSVLSRPKSREDRDRKGSHKVGRSRKPRPTPTFAGSSVGSNPIGCNETATDPVQRTPRPGERQRLRFERPMHRTKPRSGYMTCYRCDRQYLPSVKSCPVCGCVAFFHGQRLPRVFCPAFEDGPIPRLKALDLFLDEQVEDRYLDVARHEKGRRRPTRAGAL